MSTPILGPICSGDDEEEQQELPFEGNLRVGDMLFMDYGTMEFFVGDHNDHVALCTDVSDPYHPKFIDAEGSGVDEHDLYYFKTTTHMEHFLIARIIEPPAGVIDDAVDWAEQQKGLSYQPWDEFHWTVKKNETYDGDEDSIGWYCSELVWAAYYLQGIDIDNNEWTAYPFPVPNVNMGLDKILFPWFPDPHYWFLNYMMPYVFRNEILIDDNVRTVYKDKVNSGFRAGTKIQLYNGSIKNIEDVETGDLVASYDMRNDEIISAEVSNVICYTSGEITDDLFTINNEYSVTANQTLYANY